MYTQNEIFKIFRNVASWAEFEKVCSCFMYLILNGYIEKSDYLYVISHKTFRRLTNIEGNEKSKFL